jgi:hypothetical protein
MSCTIAPAMALRAYFAAVTRSLMFVGVLCCHGGGPDTPPNFTASTALSSSDGTVQQPVDPFAPESCALRGVTFLRVPPGPITTNLPPGQQWVEPRVEVMIPEFYLQSSEMNWRQLADLGVELPSDCEECFVQGLSWLEFATIADQVSEALGLEQCYLGIEVYADEMRDGTVVQQVLIPESVRSCAGARMPYVAELQYVRSLTGLESQCGVVSGNDEEITTEQRVCLERLVSNPQLFWPLNSAQRLAGVGVRGIVGQLSDLTNDGYTLTDDARFGGMRAYGAVPTDPGAYSAFQIMTTAPVATRTQTVGLRLVLPVSAECENP